MSLFPSTAEELYERVCVLQSEQQSAEKQLRVIQKGSEQLKERIATYQRAIEEERNRRQSALSRLTDALSVSRCREAERAGAMQALSDAENELHAQQAALLRVCCKESCSCLPHGKAQAFNRCPTEENIGSDDTCGAVFENASLEETMKILFGEGIGDQQGETSCMESMSADSSGKMTLPPPLLSGSSAHALLSALRVKLERCLVAAHSAEKVSTPPPSPEQLINPVPATPDAFPNVSETETKTPQCSNFNDSAPCSESSLASAASAAPSAAEPMDIFPPTVASQTLSLAKKHIDFFPGTSLHHVTPVSATNFNRMIGRPVNVPLPVTASAGSDLDSAGAAGASPAYAGTTAAAPRATTKFTVRLASRSSTLMAEAAALGGKRRRTMSTTTPNKTTTTAARDTMSPISSTGCVVNTAAATSVTQTVLTQSIPAATGIEFSRVLSEGEVGVVGSGVEVSTRSSTEMEGGGEVPPFASVHCGGDASTHGSLGRPRRTVWTWSRGGAAGKHPL